MAKIECFGSFAYVEPSCTVTFVMDVFLVQIAKLEKTMEYVEGFEIIRKPVSEEVVLENPELKGKYTIGWKGSAKSTDTNFSVNKKHGMTCPFCKPVDDKCQACWSKYCKCMDCRDDKWTRLLEAARNLRRSQWTEGEAFGEKAFLVPESDLTKLKSALFDAGGK